MTLRVMGSRKENAEVLMQNNIDYYTILPRNYNQIADKRMEVSKKSGQQFY